MSEVLRRKINIIKNDFKFIIIALIFFISGVIIGVICFKNKGKDGVFIKSVFKYYNKIFSVDTSPFSMLFTRVAVNFGYILIVFALSFSVYTYPLILGLVAYRGAIIGCVGGIFISLYGFNGGAVYFSVTLPQNLIVTLGIILAALFNFDYFLNKCKKNMTDVSVIIKNCLLGFLICLCGATYEFLVSVVILRPMNFYF